jgi:hypothetical protein
MQLTLYMALELVRGGEVRRLRLRRGLVFPRGLQLREPVADHADIVVANAVVPEVVVPDVVVPDVVVAVGCRCSSLRVFDEQTVEQILDVRLEDALLRRVLHRRLVRRPQESAHRQRASRGRSAAAWEVKLWARQCRNKSGRLIHWDGHCFLASGGAGSVLRTTVSSQVAGGAKRLAAASEVTRVRRAREMHLEVRHQLLATREDARAVRGRTTDLAHCVELAVAGEVPGRAEALAALGNGALVGLLARVRLEVFVQRELAVEAAAAVGHGAGEWSVFGRSCAARCPTGGSGRGGGIRIDVDVVGTRGEIGNGTTIEIGMRVEIMLVLLLVLAGGAALQVERGLPRVLT